MYEVFYATTRVARIAAVTRDDAKRRFAAYVLYDDATHVASDVQLSFGDNAEVSPADAPPVAGSREEMRAWSGRRDELSEAFETGLYEDPERTLEPYLRLLATNDPWRLEGHSYLGRTLSAVTLAATLTTFDARVTYRFDAAQFLDYLRLDVIRAIDPARLRESISPTQLVSVAALHDEGLRQIVSSYETILTECRLTDRFADVPAGREAFSVSFAFADWQQYLDHRLAEPQRFLPPPDWQSAWPRDGDSPTRT
jgi:hypothetical protein